MRRMIHLAFLLILGFGPLLTFAQFAPKLAIDTPVVTNPLDTLNYDSGMGDSVITYSVRIRNVGPAIASGLVDVIFRYKDSVDQVKLTVPVDLENQEFLDTLIRDTVRGTNLRYGGGVNIIVIWPRAHPDVGALAPDTSAGSIYILNLPLSRPRPGQVFDRVELYPQPADDIVHVLYKKADKRLEYVRILDLEGREVYRNTLPVRELPFGERPSGLYMVEFLYQDGARGLFKVLVQH